MDHKQSLSFVVVNCCHKSKLLLFTSLQRKLAAASDIAHAHGHVFCASGTLPFGTLPFIFYCWASSGIRIIMKGPMEGGEGGGGGE